MPVTTPITDIERSSPSDEECMVALRAGDDAALAALMERWELPVKSFLLRLGVSHGDVEDVAQEAFVRLYEKRTSYRPGAAFKPWLLTLAGNLGRNRRRWRFRRREESVEAMDEQQPGGFSVADPSARPPSEVAETNALAASVRTAVNALPANLREVIVCVDLEGLSYDEAAQVLGCSTKAVETRLYRARQTLRSTCRTLFEA